MGYHIGATSIERVQKYLDHLLKTEEKTVIFKSKVPRRLAHLLRQAFESSRLSENDYKDLKENWKVKEQIDCVVCTLKEKLVDDFEVLTTVKSIQESGIPLPHVTRIEEVIGACLENNGKVLLFPNYDPSKEQYIILERWGNNNKIEFYHTEGKLTARRKDG